MLKFVILLLALVASAFSAFTAGLPPPAPAAATAPGTTPEDTLPVEIPDDASPEDLTIYFDGDYPTTITNIPYVVSIQRNGVHTCSGSLLDDTTILTSAQCLQAVKGSNFKVRVGSTYWNSGGSLESVKSFKMHELYNPKTMLNNIGILRLRRSLSFSDGIKPIFIGYGTPGVGDFALISGWNNTTTSGSDSTPKSLQSVNFRINQSQCPGFGNEIKSKKICGVARGNDVCNFGSGGPLVVNDFIVGVVSSINGCNRSPYPIVYTDLTAVRSWIITNSRTL